MIEVRNLTKRYQNKTVVNDVSFTIPKGKVTSLIGPNGAGKSTVLGMMSRLITPDAGEVLLDGKNIRTWETNELSRQLAILKQSNHLSLRLTVHDLVSLGRFPHSGGRITTEDEVIVTQCIERMKLSAYTSAFIDQLSGGQRQRAYIAMILAQDTPYVLLDEPLNNLDMKHSVGMMRVLRELADEENKTVVTVIHDINFASCYSDTIIAFKEGKFVQGGEKDVMMQKEVLDDLYDMSFRLENINNRKICIYY
ncbi:MAG: ABC transporter ATP-binding protein [Bacilli bacterium]